MSTIVVTLRFKDHQSDLELPNNVPFYLLAPILVDKLDWPGLDPPSDNSNLSARSKPNQVFIRPYETLDQANVADGDILELIVTKPLGPNPEPISPPQDRDYLICAATNCIFPIQQRTSLIGRKQHFPMDLSELPDSEWVSREHANLIRRTNGYEIKDLDSRHGTIVDGYKLKAGEAISLRSGSQIQFGENGPVLVLHTDSSQE